MSLVVRFMNKAQRKVVIAWVSLSVLLILGAIGHEWLLDNWNWAKWPALILLILIVAGSGREGIGWSEPGRSLGSFIEEHPALKAWAMLCVFGVLISFVYALFARIELYEIAGYLLIAAIPSLLGPLLFISERERYRRLANKSNHSFNSNAAKKRGSG